MRLTIGVLAGALSFVICSQFNIEGNTIKEAIGELAVVYLLRNGRYKKRYSQSLQKVFGTYW